jgi:hypothetical protein
MAVLRLGQPLRVEALAESMTKRIAVLVLAATVPGATVASAAESDTWRPNYRIGPVKFNHPLPENVDEAVRGANGTFAVRPQGGGATVRGILFQDPNTGREGARAVWTRSTRVSFRGVRVGMHWRTARARLPGRWEVRRSTRCGWLNSYRLRRDRTGPVSTQLFFRRSTGRIYEIALNEITEIDCPRA